MPVGDVVDAQRSGLALQGLAAQLRVSRARQLVGTEAAMVTSVTEVQPRRP